MDTSSQGNETKQRNSCKRNTQADIYMYMMLIILKVWQNALPMMKKNILYGLSPEFDATKQWDSTSFKINDPIPASCGCGRGLQSRAALSYEVKGRLEFSTRKCIAA